MAIEKAGFPRFEAAMSRTRRFETLDDRDALHQLCQHPQQPYRGRRGPAAPRAQHHGRQRRGQLQLPITNNTASLSTTNETANTTRPALRTSFRCRYPRGHHGNERYRPVVQRHHDVPVVRQRHGDRARRRANRNPGQPGLLQQPARGLLPRDPRGHPRGRSHEHRNRRLGNDFQQLLRPEPPFHRGRDPGPGQFGPQHQQFAVLRHHRGGAPVRFPIHDRGLPHLPVDGDLRRHVEGILPAIDAVPVGGSAGTKPNTPVVINSINDLHRQPGWRGAA